MIWIFNDFLNYNFFFRFFFKYFFFNYNSKSYQAGVKNICFRIQNRLGRQSIADKLRYISEKFNFLRLRQDLPHRHWKSEICRQHLYRTNAPYKLTFKNKSISNSITILYTFVSYCIYLQFSFTIYTINIYKQQIYCLRHILTRKSCWKNFIHSSFIHK